MKIFWQFNLRVLLFVIFCDIVIPGMFPDDATADNHQKAESIDTFLQYSNRAEDLCQTDYTCCREQVFLSDFNRHQHPIVTTIPLIPGQGGGEFPIHLEIDDEENILFVANEDSNNVPLKEKGITLGEKVNETGSNTIPEHGTIKKGKIGGNENGTVPPRIALWFIPKEGAPCKEYRWYQFVHPSLFIEIKSPEGMNTPAKDYTPKDFEMTTSGGIKIKFCNWTNDYVKREIDKEKKQRKKNKGKPFPDFRPKGKDIPKNKTNPYNEHPLPGIGKNGLIDAPDFTQRESSRSKSAMDEVVRKAFKPNATSETEPDPLVIEVQLKLEFQSYLICIDTGECIACVHWEYSNTVTYTFSWKVEGLADSTFGIGPKKWVLNRAATSPTTYTLIFGKVTSCDGKKEIK